MALNRLKFGFATCATAVVAVLSAHGAQAEAREAGAPPAAFASRVEPAARAAAPSSGLKTFFRRFGRYQLSVSAGGSIETAPSLVVQRPAPDAVVEKAFLMSTSFGFGRFGDDDIRLDGQPITWMAQQYDGPGFLTAALANVTDIVKAKVDAAAGPRSQFRAREANTGADGVSGVNGETLVVVFRTPSDDRPRTIALLFGTQDPSGDAFEIGLNRPINPNRAGARADMGVGVQHSNQVNGAQQASVITVNGRRLTSSAGGEDDGAPDNGALITVGGLGDSNDNPADPNAGPTNARSDDERYSLLPFLTRDAASIRVETTGVAGDQMFFAWLDLSSPGEEDADTDGDGLPDAWEISGYDHDGDGVVDVDLPALGARPDHKDLFVAYAWMRKGDGEEENHRPAPEVLQAIVDAFAAAPVPNPDGVRGVTVHFKDLGSVPHKEDLNPLWSDFDAVMDPRVSEAERKVYRRMLNAHAIEGGSALGKARGIPSSDFVESFGRDLANPGVFRERAGTIMHELGHTLGLRHGGVDSVDNKPNQLSVMSSFYQLDWMLYDGEPKLDYNQLDILGQNEAQLNERIGLRGASARDEERLKRFPVTWFANGFNFQKRTLANRDVDWNANGTIEQRSLADLNGNGTFQTLRGRYVEWDNLIFDGGAIGASGPRGSMIAGPEDLKELDGPAIARLRKARKALSAE